jgi:membrane peptidoglycan carboxypeptidase
VDTTGQTTPSPEDQEREEPAAAREESERQGAERQAEPTDPTDATIPALPQPQSNGSDANIAVGDNTLGDNTLGDDTLVEQGRAAAGDDGAATHAGDAGEGAALPQPSSPQDPADWHEDAERPLYANARAVEGSDDSDGAYRAAFDDDDWPMLGSPSHPIGSPQRRAVHSRAWIRRRRRHASFIKRTVRARQAAKSATIARAAWASTIVLAVLVLSALTASAGAAASYYQSESGLIQGLQRSVAAKDSVRIYDDKGTVLYQFNQDGAQHSISLARVPVGVVNATVAIEDHDFWVNDGVDFTSIARAAIDDVQSGRIAEGGSTITQQLIKGQLLGGNVQFTRKLNEAILALGMTAQGVYTKSQIMQMYLNSIPYSPTAYGIDAAAQEYFGYQDDPNSGMTAAQHLDVAQASMLAGIPQNPNSNDPLLHPQAARTRQATVLNDMVQFGYITQAQAQQAWQEAGKPGFFHPMTAEQNKAPHMVYYVLNQLQQMIDTGQLHNLARSGLNIYTTLDLDLQNHVQQAMKDHLYGNDIAGYGGYVRDSNLTNSAAVLVDQHTGDVKVLLGSVDYYSTKIDGKFDVATEGYRGPGSSFKPLVYAAAFEKGWFPGMAIDDMPTVFWDEGLQKVYKPLNFNPTQFHGEITVRQALQWSLNIPAVKTMQFVTVADAEREAERMGITQWAPGSSWGLSSVLGSLDVTPFEMVQAYTVLANYGQYIPLHTINKITDSTGRELFRYQVPQPVQVMDPRIAYLVTSVLQDNVTRTPDFGMCSPLYLDPSQSDCFSYGGNSPHAWPAAAKTGTGQNFTDDWTMGYTMNYTLGVWAGNNNNTPMVNIDGITGAAPIWYHSMLYAMHNLPITQFPVPNGLERVTYSSNGITSTDLALQGQALPNNTGSGGPNTVPCIKLDTQQGGWNYSTPPDCDGQKV